MTKATLYIFLILTLTRCLNSLEVPKSVEVKYHDPILRPFFNALKTVNRDSMGFAPLDSTSIINYKEEFEGTLVKLFFVKPGYITILYFHKSNNDIIYSSEDETTTGPRTLTVKDVDGFKSIIQETISRSYDENKSNLLGKNLRITFLDIDKYPDKRPYNQDSSVHYPQVTYETEISLEQSKEVIARWKSL